MRGGRYQNPGNFQPRGVQNQQPGMDYQNTQGNFNSNSHREWDNQSYRGSGQDNWNQQGGYRHNDSQAQYYHAQANYNGGYDQRRRHRVTTIFNQLSTRDPINSHQVPLLMALYTYELLISSRSKDAISLFLWIHVYILSFDGKQCRSRSAGF